MSGYEHGVDRLVKFFQIASKVKIDDSVNEYLSVLPDLISQADTFLKASEGDMNEALHNFKLANSNEYSKRFFRIDMLIRMECSFRFCHGRHAKLWSSLRNNHQIFI